jgi:NDP-sugar pyrophosphorylase family protein
MVLAAGHGRRLRPVTDHVPKPLLPILGRSLLEIIVGNLNRLGVPQIGINTHHLADRVVAKVADWEEGKRFPGCRTTLFHEPKILGTGGALWNAREFLARDELFLLHNGDVLTDFDLRILWREHLRMQPWVTLALTDWPQVNTVLLGADGAVRDIGARLGAGPAPGDRGLTYTGIAAISRRFLDLLPPGPSSIVDALVRAIDAYPRAVRGLVLAGCYWNDLGVLGRYLDANEDLLVKQRVELAGSTATGRRIFLGEGANVSDEARWRGFLSLGRGAVVGPGARLEDCVLLDGATVGRHETYRRAVIGDGWVTSESPGPVARLSVLGPWRKEREIRIERLTGHGSDREFWRLVVGEDTGILMRSTDADPEFERFVAVGRFLHAEDLGGPALLAVDTDDRAVLMEDLGTESLFERIRRRSGGAAPGSPAALRPGADDLLWYRPTLDLLVRLQVHGTAQLRRCPPAGDRLFDYDTLRWETDYFRQRFLGDYAGIGPQDCDRLDQEFHLLAESVLQQPVVLMHRDFQSQNILILNGRIRIVDFQGARRGPMAYDVMSLLRDSYVEIDQTARARLLEYYRTRLADAGGPRLTAGELEAMAVTAGLQRNMQALGAFAFLSRVKGKRAFERHVPLGLRHLAAGLADLHKSGADTGPLVNLERIVGRLTRTEP